MLESRCVRAHGTPIVEPSKHVGQTRSLLLDELETLWIGLGLGNAHEATLCMRVAMQF